MSQGVLTLSSTYNLPAGNTPYGLTTFGTNVYVCMTAAGASGIVQLNTDPTTGAVSQIAAMVSTTNGPRRCRVSPDGKNLYVPTGYSELHTFTRNTTDGSLSNPIKQAQPTTPVDATLSAPVDVDISPDNAHVYIANSYGGSASANVMVYSRAANGSLTPIQRFVLSGTFAVRCSPDGNSIFIACQNTNLLHWYRRDNNPQSATYGQITTLVASIATPSNIPACIDITDDGKYVYEANDNGNQYTGCFFVDTVNNVLVDRSFRVTNSDTNGGAWWLALSRDIGNTSLYVALSDVQKISQYTRNTTDGTISLKTPGSVTTSYYTAGAPHGSGGPNGVAVSPSNKFLFAPNVTANTLDVFTIEQPVATTTPVYSDYVGRFDVLNTVSRDFVGTFDVSAALAAVSRDFVGTFDVQNKVWRDYTSSFNVNAPNNGVSFSASSVNAARKVVFTGGTRVVAFEGGTRTVRF